MKTYKNVLKLALLGSLVVTVHGVAQARENNTSPSEARYIYSLPQGQLEDIDGIEEWQEIVRTNPNSWRTHTNFYPPGTTHRSSLFTVFTVAGAKFNRHHGVTVTKNRGFLKISASQQKTRVR